MFESFALALTSDTLRVEHAFDYCVCVCGGGGREGGLEDLVSPGIFFLALTNKQGRYCFPVKEPCMTYVSLLRMFFFVL